jgi:muramoyltetrapeptide carboxypeptidase
MIIPNKLKKGDEIRVVAPSRSLSLISNENIKLAENKLKKLGFKVTYSKNCKEKDIFMSSSIKSRINDLHYAFKDKNVKAILTAIGGFNSNHLLKYINYDLIKKNPKILCGFSDITAICNAITAKTKLVTYSGVHFSTFAMKKEFEYNIEYFQKCLMENKEYEILPSKTWSDDSWYKNQEKRNIKKNYGQIILNKGQAKGKVYGGNLGTFRLLYGTKYFPNIKNSIIMIEECFGGEKNFVEEFDRNLQSLIHQKNFSKVKAILIGRFQKKSKMNLEKINYIIKTKKELEKIPIAINFDFGHTNPMFTFPIGGEIEIDFKNYAKIKFLKH